MVKMAQSVTTGLTKAWNWLRGSFAGSRTILWKVRSYAPIITGSVFGLGLALFPAIFNTHYWTYMITVPLGIAGGFAAYMAVFIAMDEE